MGKLVLGLMLISMSQFGLANEHTLGVVDIETPSVENSLYSAYGTDGKIYNVDPSKRRSRLAMSKLCMWCSRYPKNDLSCQ